MHPRSEAVSITHEFFVTGDSSKITLAKIPAFRLKMILFWVRSFGRFSPLPHWPLFT